MLPAKETGYICFKNHKQSDFKVKIIFIKYCLQGKVVCLEIIMLFLLYVVTNTWSMYLGTLFVEAT